MATKMWDISIGGGQLAIINGDFVIVESTAAHQERLLLDNKGDYKENPTVGVGAFNYFNDDDEGELLREISEQFTTDGMTVSAIRMGANGIISTDANY